jgi:hypothetical protein
MIPHSVHLVDPFYPDTSDSDCSVDAAAAAGASHASPPAAPPNKVTKSVIFWARGKPLIFFWPY